MSGCLYVFLFVCLSFYLSIYMFVCLSVYCLFIYFVSMLICLFACRFLSVNLFVYISVCFLLVCLFVCLFVCLRCSCVPSSRRGSSMKLNICVKVTSVTSLSLSLSLLVIAKIEPKSQGQSQTPPLLTRHTCLTHTHLTCPPHTPTSHLSFLLTFIIRRQDNMDVAGRDD